MPDVAAVVGEQHADHEQLVTMVGIGAAAEFPERSWWYSRFAVHSDDHLASAAAREGP